MKDLSTGLTIVPLDHLPPSLVQAVLKGPPSPERVPVVFFAEVMQKLSANAKKRFSKDRLVLVCPDAILVYSTDGFVKRRIKIAEVAALYIVNSGEKMPQTPPPQGASATSIATLTAGAHQQHVTTVGIISPSSYDCAFDTTSVRQHHIATQLTRIVTVLYRRWATTAAAARGKPLEIKVVTLPDFDPTKPAHALFKLKKPLDSSRHPLLPPTLEVVSEEVLRLKERDSKLQVEEVLSDLLNHLDRYKRECWVERNDLYITVLKRLTAQRASLEALMQQAQKLRKEVEAGTKKNSRRAEQVRIGMAEAQKHLMEVIGRITTLRNQHAAFVEATRHSIEDCDTQVRVLSNKEITESDRYVVLMHEHEVNRLNVQKQSDETRKELEGVALLPTLNDLRGEIARLEEATREQECAREEIQSKDCRGVELARATKEQEARNVEMQEEILIAKHALRDAKEFTQQLVGRVSQMLAKRNRLVSHIQTTQKGCLDAQAEIERLQEHMLGGLRPQYDYLTEQLSALELERSACQDLERETLIHDSISTSLTRLATTEEATAETVHAKLREKLNRLSNKANLYAAMTY